MKWMAAAEPLQAEPDTLRWPMDFDGLTHVLRTGRMETAGGWKEGRYQELVTPEEDSDGRSDGLAGTTAAEFLLHLTNRRFTSA